MQFITSGQRIATENFEQGVIYKVTFIDDNIAYMMCAGIGSDFVMLMSSEPRLFSLTIDSASLISEIDIHDPTPPEPPMPLENVLQYQTGEPPFTFTTTESSLFSWYIEGAAGVKTANLFDVNDTMINTFVRAGNTTPLNPLGQEVSNVGFNCSGYIPINENAQYTVEYPAFQGAAGAGMVFYTAPSIDNAILGIPTNEQSIKYTFTTPIGAKYLRLSWKNSQGNNVMLNTGSTALPYEPYGYKISIFTNEHTATIYLDEPIAEGEKLYSVNIDAQIITDIGENTLSVSDPQPPEMQIVYGIYAEG